jgi:hypothetical protein
MFSNLEYPDEGSNRTAGAQIDSNLCLLQSKCASGATSKRYKILDTN